MTPQASELRIRLRHLRTFLEVARERGVGRAAARLHVSQPAVTKTIRELEELLGAALFHREGRRVRLTAAGEVLLPYAAQALSAIRRGIESVTSDEAGPLVRIGALPTVSARIMPAAVAALTRESPAPRLRLVTGENAVLLEQLRSGALDMVVGRLAEPDRMTGFFFEHLYSEQVVFVVRPGHPLLAAGGDAFGRLADFPMLMPPQGSVIRPFVERFLLTRAVARPRTVIETISDSFGRAFVRVEDAVWVISEGVVARDLAEGLLAALPVDTGDTRGPVGLTMRTDARTQPGLERIMLAIRQAAQDHGPA
jgi:LysR family pca operon transcriptional activator